MRNKLTASEQRRRAGVERRRQDKQADYWIDSLPGLEVAPSLLKLELVSPEKRDALVVAWERVARSWDRMARECRALRDGSTRNVCPTCGETYVPARADQRFCSGKCRQAGYRARLASG